MFCPRCGHENEDDSRFCVECGKRLRSDPEAKGADVAAVEGEPPRGGLRTIGHRLVGSTRRERLVTAGIAAALVIAAVSLFALPSEDETPADPRDPYIQELDAICLDAKVELQAARAEAADAPQVGVNSVRVYTRRFAPITERFRARMAALEPPPQYAAKVAELDDALRRIAAAGRRGASFPQAQGERTLAELGRVQRIGGRVESLVTELGLTACETVKVTSSEIGDGALAARAGTGGCAPCHGRGRNRWTRS